MTTLTGARQSIVAFTYEDGRPVHPDSIRERFKRLAARAGMDEDAATRAAGYMLGCRETPETAPHP